MNSTFPMVKRWVGGFVLISAVALITVLLVPSSVVPALACEGEFDGHVLAANDLNQVPPQIIQDARNVAQKYYSWDKVKANDMANQLVGSYIAAADKDFVVIFNPGGWGWDPVSEIAGWESILLGIKSKLGDAGYKTLLMDYKRTRHGFNGVIGETEVLFGLQPIKAEELAARVTFLTEHLPNLRVILTGESNGATIADDSLRLLKDNLRVFAIETGPPVWHPSLDFERSLIIKNNGVQDDTFSNGNVILILRSNLESIFGIYSGGKGDILLYIGAPGHYYNWDYIRVRSLIERFITETILATSV
jgi:hypothetical protein